MMEAEDVLRARCIKVAQVEPRLIDAARAIKQLGRDGEKRASGVSRRSKPYSEGTEYGHGAF